MLFAKYVTSENIKLITMVNDGIMPDQECLDKSTVFVYSDDPEVHNQLLDADVFNDNYKWVNDFPNDNEVVEI